MENKKTNVVVTLYYDTESDKVANYVIGKCPADRLVMVSQFACMNASIMVAFHKTMDDDTAHRLTVDVADITVTLSIVNDRILNE